MHEPVIYLSNKELGAKPRLPCHPTVASGPENEDQMRAEVQKLCSLEDSGYRVSGHVQLVLVRKTRAITKYIRPKIGRTGSQPVTSKTRVS